MRNTTRIAITTRPSSRYHLNARAHGASVRRAATTMPATASTSASSSGFVVRLAAVASPIAQIHHAIGCTRAREPRRGERAAHAMPTGAGRATASAPPATRPSTSTMPTSAGSGEPESSGEIVRCVIGGRSTTCAAIVVVVSFVAGAVFAAPVVVGGNVGAAVAGAVLGGVAGVVVTAAGVTVGSGGVVVGGTVVGVVVVAGGAGARIAADGSTPGFA